MNAIRVIKEKLQKYSQVRYEMTENSITVLPVSECGFKVRFDVNAKDFTVSFNGWHEDFQDENEALNCFAFGLSSDCRLKEFRRGNFAYKWTVEAQRDGKWIEESTTGLLFFPFWKTESVHYLQNDLLK